MNNVLSLYEYPELAEIEQNQVITSVLGSLMEEPVLYVPAYGQLAGDSYAGYFLSWMVRSCPYNQSVPISDVDMRDGLGFSKHRWHNVRRLLKQHGFLLSERSGVHTVYSLNEKHFSDALREQDNALRGDSTYSMMPSVPVDRLCAAAMLQSGFKINDVLFYFMVQAQQRYQTPDKRGDFSEWILYTEAQVKAMSILNEAEQHRSMKALAKAGLLEAGRHPFYELTVFRLNHKAMADLSWQYLHNPQV
ncbi:hypothetical protein [Neisseria sp. S1]|uniref:hypothetical protein n=1 Tax=Neisseria sp. S1 TaxID=3318354 RepID=UPI003A86C6DC